MISFCTYSEEKQHNRRIILAIVAINLICLGILGISTRAAINGLEYAQQTSLSDVAKHLNMMQSRIDNTQRSGPSARVTLTCYQSFAAQTDSTPQITAINTRVRPGIVAVSRDLIEQGWVFGRRVWIEGHGVYRIADIMNARHTKAIDIWVPETGPMIKETNTLACLIKE